MQLPVQPADVVDIAQYEKLRPGFRQQVIAEKERRRVRVGEHFTFLFENRLTVRYQIQEMLRTERIVAQAAIDHEIETYNELIPPPGGLSATLLIEYTTRAEREVHLPRLLGLERHVTLRVGDLSPVPAAFDTRQMGEERLSSVQYVTFALGEPHRQSWSQAAAQGRLRLVVDHPHYRAETALGPEVAAALAEDFS
ncbi:MAG: DUF3501 family protein [Candidatus Lambdaproteobacteria bacterium]|nr:DUF3501 family protein [Candidatus Lambdaproteobacteria bacterium]